MNLRDFLIPKRRKPLTDPGMSEDQIEQAAAEVDAFRVLKASAGWRLLSEQLQDAAEAALDQWTAGTIAPAVSERLAARVETIRWVLTLPDQRIASYNAFVQELAALAKEGEEQAPDGL
ncbi:MAG TPA: hypothetical protein VJP78_13120 [Thermoleophilia bacterium]|nr:hypothetical protein [Thermoleophilia bacterium]